MNTKFVVQFGGTFVKKKLFTSLLSATVLSTSLIGATPVLADEFDTQIEEAQQEAVQNEAAANELDAIINQLTNDMDNTQSALNNLNSEIQRNESLLAEAVANLETANKEMNQLLEEIEKLEENIARREEKLEEQAREIQVSGNSTNYFEYILEAESITDVVARVDIVTNIVRSSNSMMEDQIKDKEQVAQKTEETERKIVQQNAIAGELEQASATLEGQRASQEALVLQLELERSTASGDRESLLAQRNEALQRVNNIQSEQEIARVAAEEAAAERAREEAQTEVVEETTQVEVANVSPASSNQEESNNGSSANNEPAQQSQPRQEQPSNNNGNNGGGGNTQTPAPNPTPAPKPKPQPKPDPKPSVPTGNVISIANGWLGTSYLYGGNSRSGIDCSAFVQQVFSAAGKSISRTTWSQYASAQKVSSPSVGDLVFFSNGNNGNIDHVGIYAGNGQFIGSQTSTGVAYASTTSGYWASRIVGYGRY